MGAIQPVFITKKDLEVEKILTLVIAVDDKRKKDLVDAFKKRLAQSSLYNSLVEQFTGKNIPFVVI